MKIAISSPDQTFERVTATARSAGVSRSELFTRAAIDYMKRLESAALVVEIDRAVDVLAGDDSSAVAAAAGRSRLVGGDEPGW